MSDYEIGILNRNVLIKIVKEQQEIINKAIEYIDEKGRLKYKPEELKSILKGEEINE